MFERKNENILSRIAARASSLHWPVAVSRNIFFKSETTFVHTAGQPPLPPLFFMREERLRVKSEVSGRLISGREKAWADEMRRAKQMIFLNIDMMIAYTMLLRYCLMNSMAGCYGGILPDFISKETSSLRCLTAREREGGEGWVSTLPSI